MRSVAASPEEYINSLADDRKQAIAELRNTISNNLPAGFEETMGYGMIGYVVPHTLYPNGYHCDPKLPLPFINIASQKNFIAIYHMGLYADENLLKWYKNEYAKYSKLKLDMGKSCLRFKKLGDIPLELIGKLASKVTLQQWIQCYEKAFIKKSEEI